MIPRISSKQTLRSNYPTSNSIECYNISVYIPYLDSSLKRHCHEINKNAFFIFSARPKILKKFEINEIIMHLNNIKTFYGKFVDSVWKKN